MASFFDKVYDGLFKIDRKDEKWVYEDKLVKNKIAQTKKTGTPPDLIDPIEIRYYDKLLRQIKTLVGVSSFSGMKVAEFGSGTGLLSVQIAREGANVDLVDILPSCLQYARMVTNYLRQKGEFLGKVNYVNEDFLNLKRDSVYHLVHSMGVIEHFEDDMAFNMVRKMASCTRQGGHVVVGTPNYFCPDVINIWRKHGKGNERFFSKEMMRSMLKRAELSKCKVITSTFCYPSFVPAAIVERTSILEDFLGSKLGLGFLVIGVGTQLSSRLK